jgi:hypothetical protein
MRAHFHSTRTKGLCRYHNSGMLKSLFILLAKEITSLIMRLNSGAFCCCLEGDWGEVMEKHESADKERFRPVSGLKLVFEPGNPCDESAKKHPCPDCHFCQYCSDTRCQSCRGKKNGPHKCPARKLSLCEQIRLYEEVNAKTR